MDRLPKSKERERKEGRKKGRKRRKEEGDVAALYSTALLALKAREKSRIKFSGQWKIIGVDILTHMRNFCKFHVHVWANGRDYVEENITSVKIMVIFLQSLSQYFCCWIKSTRSS